MAPCAIQQSSIPDLFGAAEVARQIADFFLFLCLVQRIAELASQQLIDLLTAGRAKFRREVHIIFL